MTARDILISVNNVTDSYPVKCGFLKWSQYTPLKEISFDLFRGETLGIIGRNGSGKSTLLRLIAGIVEPVSGQIINYGAKVSLLALGVGFMRHLTGRENVILSGMFLGLSKREIEDRMNAIIEFSELGEFIDQPLRTYSSGMQVRLSFSTAIQINPDVLLIDEVLGVGDEQFRIKSSAELRKMIRSDKTVVLVSHNLAVIRELCSKVAWIKDGTIKRIGETDIILRDYQQNSHVIN